MHHQNHLTSIIYVQDISNSLGFQWGFVASPSTSGTQQINFNVQFTQVYQVTANLCSVNKESLSGSTTSKEYVHACAKTLYGVANHCFCLTYAYTSSDTNRGTSYIAVGKL